MLEDVVALPEIPADIQIETLYEMDCEEIGGVLGYYCCGHYQSQSFVEAVKEECGTDAEISASWVQHQYWKMSETETGDFHFFECSVNSPGSFPVTFIEF